VKLRVLRLLSAGQVRADAARLAENEGHGGDERDVAGSNLSITVVYAPKAGPTAPARLENPIGAHWSRVQARFFLEQVDHLPYAFKKETCVCNRYSSSKLF